MKLYRAGFDDSDGDPNDVDYLVEMDEIHGSRDWFGANRSIIDAQTYVNDYDLMKYGMREGCTIGSCYGTGGGMYLRGREEPGRVVGKLPYRGRCAEFILDDTAYVVPHSGGTVTLDAAIAGSITQFVGYYPIQLPDYHDGTLLVETPSQPFRRGLWYLDLFDAAGRPIAGQVERLITGDFASGHTVGTFPVPAGPETLYLRVGELTENASNSSVDVTAEQMKLERGFGPPPAILRSASVRTMLPTDPFGDGEISSSSGGQFMFRALAGQLSVEVVPSRPRDDTFRWGVYADTDGDLRFELLAWDQTTGSVNRNTQTSLLLPETRQPIRMQEYAYDREELGADSVCAVPRYPGVRRADLWTGRLPDHGR